MENAVHLLSQKSDFAVSAVFTQDLVDELQAAVLVTTDALDVRLDTAEAKSSYQDPTTQTLLTAEATSRVGGDNTLTTALGVERVRIDNILNLASAPLDTLKELSDSFQAADVTLTDAVTAIVSEHNSELATEQTTRGDADTALDARLDLVEASNWVTETRILNDAVTADKLANSINSEISANTAKTGISSGQSSAISANTAKNSYPGSADATELNILDGCTRSTAQLNYVDATSSIQTQLDLKSPLDGPNFTSNVLVASNIKPTTDLSASSLGSVSKRFLDGYIGNVKLSSHGSGDGVIAGVNDVNLRVTNDINFKSTAEFDVNCITNNGVQFKSQSVPSAPSGSNSITIWNEGSGILKSIQGNDKERVIQQAENGGARLLLGENVAGDAYIQIHRGLYAEGKYLLMQALSWYSRIQSMPITRPLILNELGAKTLIGTSADTVDTANFIVGSTTYFDDTVKMKEPLTLGAYTLPKVAGAADQVLTYPSSGSNVTWEDASSGGSSIPTFITVTEITDQGSKPYGSLVVAGGTLVVQNTSGSHYSRLPSYGSTTVKTWLDIVNGGNSSFYVATADYGNDGTTSTTQKMYMEKMTATATYTLGVASSGRRLSKLILMDRSNGVESWLLAWTT